jgi:AcrR family transcriptional regulator
MPDDERDDRPDRAVAVVRRAPFSDNPRVGARGQRAQQRILDAALVAFGEQGYHDCSIDRITKLARCSRVSFYQYFANKEDVFRQLAGQVARQVSASTEALDPLTSDASG